MIRVGSRKDGNRKVGSLKVEGPKVLKSSAAAPPQGVNFRFSAPRSFRRRLCASAVLVAALGLPPLSLRTAAQTASDPNEGSRLSRDASTGALTFSFWGRAGRVYLLQHSDDLYKPWNDLPMNAAGVDAPIHFGLLPSPMPDRFFLRLRSFTVAAVDADGDGVFDNLDAFPFDPTRSVPGLPIPGDTAAPLIFVDRPTNLVPL